MTAVSRCVRGVKGIAALAGLLLSLSATVRAQEGQPDDFHVGDRIALTIEGPQIFSDTVVVRDGLILRLPNIGDIPMAGVKRSDVESYLTQQIGKYIRNPVVHATPLVRIAILGQVGRPGFYTMPSDVLLSDVVMRAGGPTGNADLNRTVVKRAGQEVISKEQVASALTAGMTLDQLHIAPGDEMVIGEKPNSLWGTVLTVIGVTVPLITLLIYLKR
jgi:protein involved in polysaccharide export with SLBB domain